MLRCIVFIASVLGLLVSCAAGASVQTTPEKMTGILLVDGVQAGTAFLVADNGRTAVILTAAHCLPRSYPAETCLVQFAPGAYFQNGRLRAPCGVFDTTGKAYMKGEFFQYRDARSGLNYFRRAEHDWLVIELTRSPGLGCFNLLIDTPAKGLLCAGYADVAGGKLWTGECGNPSYSSECDWELFCDGLVHSKAAGTSGGPIYLKDKNGRWSAIAIHTGFGPEDSVRMGHRRITPQIYLLVDSLMEDRVATR